MSTHGWRTSRYSGNGLDCVEVAPAERGVLLRDSKDHGAGPVIAFTPDQWTAFLREVTTAASGANRAVTVHTVGTETHLLAVASEVTLRFTASEWAAFQSGVHDGEFDLLVRS
ncbi:MAG: DUF397 domain-containing protein [Pseudonocardia sp.]